MAQNNSFNSYVDSLFAEMKIDTSGYAVTNLLAANIADWSTQKFNLVEENNDCSDFFVVMPNIETFLDPKELDYVLDSDSIDYQFIYLSDNNIKGSLYRIQADSLKMRMKFERLGTDINVNFGQVISTSYYQAGLIRFFFNNECKKLRSINSARFFYYCDKRIIKEILVTEKAGKVSCRQVTEK
ncbi:MAG: hypothetical protein K8H86_09300 [Ignavibacteriaceae bacterium]|nr:hypothetical protein [Ignavibacteriaceae bacterium]